MGVVARPHRHRQAHDWCWPLARSSMGYLEEGNIATQVYFKLGWVAKVHGSCSNSKTGKSRRTSSLWAEPIHGFVDAVDPSTS